MYQRNLINGMNLKEGMNSKGFVNSLPIGYQIAYQPGTPVKFTIDVVQAIDHL